MDHKHSNLSSLKVVELKERLTELGLSTKGLKAVLVARLQGAIDAMENENESGAEHTHEQDQKPKTETDIKKKKKPYWFFSVRSILIFRVVHSVLWVLGAFAIGYYTDTISIGWSMLPTAIRVGIVPLSIFYLWIGVIMVVESHSSPDNSLLVLCLSGDPKIPDDGICTHLRHPFLMSTFHLLLSVAVALGSFYVVGWLLLYCVLMFAYTFAIEEPFLKKHLNATTIGYGSGTDSSIDLYSVYRRNISAFIAHRNLFNNISHIGHGHVVGLEHVKYFMKQEQKPKHE